VLRPHLVDKYLAFADLRLFGLHPALYLSHRLTGIAMDALLVCYYTYFLWPVLLGVWLYRRDARTVQTYILSLTLCFTINFICYVFFPAIGPRYYLAWALREPLQGTVLTPYLESLMRDPAFARDCFPSGHTAGTLIVLIFAFRHCRRFFWFMLPFAAGLLVATLAGRFHYAVDLLCAVPLALGVVGAATALYRARPAGLVFSPQGASLGQPLRA
jgi:membrane-associated phospholipid phosphatase